MQLALYAPGLGYYTGGSTKLGGSGDFVTAPEISSLFGQSLARQIGEVLAVTGGEVLELGAGSGRMAADILIALEQAGRPPERYAILEVSADLREQQRQRLAQLPPSLSSRVSWIDTLPQTFSGVVVANEVLDALPTHLVRWDGTSLLERGVAWRNDDLAWSDRPLSDPALLERAHRLHPTPPYASEISLAVPALIAALGAMLERGLLLLVDYGFGQSEYYHAQRSQGTLMCHYRHRAHDAPFFLPGLQDITSHVDFTAVAQAGMQHGAQLLGYATQAQFLINVGITDLLEAAAAADSLAYAKCAAQAQKLLSPAEMGELFKVVALGSGIATPLCGFRTGDKSRLL